MTLAEDLTVSLSTSSVPPCRRWVSCEPPALALMKTPSSPQSEVQPTSFLLYYDSHPPRVSCPSTLEKHFLNLTPRCTPPGSCTCLKPLDFLHTAKLCYWFKSQFHWIQGTTDDEIFPGNHAVEERYTHVSDIYGLEIRVLPFLCFLTSTFTFSP